MQAGEGGSFEEDPGAIAGGSAAAAGPLPMLNKSCTRRKLTRKEQRDLDIEIAFMEGVIQRDALFIEAWKVLSDAYSRRGKFDDGLRADEHLARILPDDPAVHYNLACSYSLLKNFESAASALGRAISKGFTDFKWLMKDPDLSPLRKEPPFKKIWAKISAFQAE
jgi:tetratricopeptide (TPR) repeat protein